MSAGGGAAGGLMRALGVDIAIAAESGGVAAWADQPDETRQRLIEIAQRVFKDTLDGVVRFEHESITPQRYSQSLVVFATPTPAHKDIVLGGARELANRIQEDISTRLGRMGIRPSVEVVQDRSFTSGNAAPPVMQGPGAAGSGYGGNAGSGYGSQGAVTTMQSSGSGEGSGPVPMVLVPAFGQRQEAPPPPPPAEEKPIIPRRMYGLLIASAIAGVSLAANAFLGARYMSIRSENVAARQQLAAQSKEAQDRFTKLDKDYTVLQERHRIFEAEEKSGTELRAQAERLRASIQSVATTAGIRATELGPVPELRTAWTSSLYGYIESQQKELTRLEAEARRRGQAAAAAAAAQAKREAPVVPPSSRGAPTPPR